jgi:hypothetical protein
MGHLKSYLDTIGHVMKRFKYGVVYFERVKVKLMKSKIFLLMLAGILFTVFFSGNVSEICIAEDEFYKISMDTSSEFVKTTEIGGDTWIFFNISITLHNFGNIESDNITVELQDEYSNYTREGSVMPGERTFIFVEHPLLGLGKHKLGVSYYPTDLSIPMNDDNSGYTTFAVEYENGDDDGSTPGFEIISLICIVVLIVLIRKRRNI